MSEYEIFESENIFSAWEVFPTAEIITKTDGGFIAFRSWEAFKQYSEGKI